MDQCTLNTVIMSDMRRCVSEATGLEMENIFLHTTHSHTTPAVIMNAENPLQREYYQFLIRRLGDVTRFATVRAPSNMPRPEELEQAHKYYDLHVNGHDDQIPFKAMELTTVVAEATRMVKLEHGPEYYDLLVSGLAIGPVALLGLAGEPFDGVGRALKEAEGWAVVLSCCQTNGREGYFPMKETYEQGGYETRSSYYKVGVAELLIESGLEVLKTMRNMK